MPTPAHPPTPRSRSFLVAILALATAFVSCYDHQAPAADEIASVTLPAAAVADGTTLVPIEVTMDPATPGSVAITITVSTGIVNFAAPATESSARQIALRNDGTGHLTTPWMVGTRAGEAVVTLALAGVTRSRTITLARSEPASMTLGLDATVLKLDGSAHTLATVTLSPADPGRLVSDGTIVRFGFCCPDETGQDASTVCADPPPLTVPVQVTAAGAVATATVATQVASLVSADAGSTPPAHVFLIATTLPGTSCRPPAGAWASAKLTLRVPHAD